MKLVMLILNKTECLDELLEEFAEAELPGATIVDSRGMVQELNEMEDDFRIAGSLRHFFAPAHSENKTVFMVVKDEDVATVSRLVNKATGGLENPDTGILFTLAIDDVEGITR